MRRGKSEERKENPRKRKVGEGENPEGKVERMRGGEEKEKNRKREKKTNVLKFRKKIDILKKKKKKKKTTLTVMCRIQ